ncbi:MAG: LEA type 2 family protein [Bacteroidales bacterium]|nr:LEA type 2 family protein [Bacteroidales bacterium]
MKRIFIVAVMSVLLSGCDVLQQVQQIQTFAKCEFKMEKVHQVELAGVNFDQLSNWSDLNFMQLANITSALTRSTVPLEMTIDVLTRNPNPVNASMQKMQWILEVENEEITRGTLNQKVNVAANGGSTTVPIRIQVDLKSVLAGKSGDAILKFAQSMAGVSSDPGKITLKVKPSVDVRGFVIDYPSYISLTKEFKRN